MNPFLFSEDKEPRRLLSSLVLDLLNLEAPKLDLRISGLGMVIHTCSPSTQEVWFQARLGVIASSRPTWAT